MIVPPSHLREVIWCLPRGRKEQVTHSNCMSQFNINILVHIIYNVCYVVIYLFIMLIQSGDCNRPFAIPKTEAWFKIKLNKPFLFDYKISSLKERNVFIKNKIYLQLKCQFFFLFSFFALIYYKHRSPNYNFIYVNNNTNALIVVLD